MAPLALKLDNVSKLYRLGQVGTGTLAHDLNRLFARAIGREDPLSKVGAVNDREQAGDDDYVWALRDISFEVEQGQVIGVIGRNGAGKSTLLKLLSRVTAPTHGSILINGRIASLLEVGTGFHPELTGRENVFLNGAILGMSKREIRARFDEIVEFSGCAKYIDTPVKRYSSGMYVRLAFAVAAHLRTDILIVDEVLAVGDADFQTRCIAKMRDVSQSSGATVLFVSHNMASVRQLCPTSILLDRGMMVEAGETNTIIERYVRAAGPADRRIVYPQSEPFANSEFGLHSIEVRGGDGTVERPLSNDEEIRIAVRYVLHSPAPRLRIGALLFGRSGEHIFTTSDFGARQISPSGATGLFETVCRIPARLLNAGYYQIEFRFEAISQGALIQPVILAFEVTEAVFSSLGPIVARQPPGLIHPDLEWAVSPVQSHAA